MSTLMTLTATGLGLAALYFLIASGLSLVFGLADVLNFAHGLFLSVGAYATWLVAQHAAFPLALTAGVVAGAASAVLVEVVMIRPLYRRTIEQVLVTVGLSLVGVAALQLAWGPDPLTFPTPNWATRVLSLAGAAIPVSGLALVGAAVAVLLALQLFLRRTRTGLVVRAAVEDREMVTALGIDVSRYFTLIFAVGGAAAAFAGGLGGLYFAAIAPEQGNSLLVTAIIVVVIGGLGSITGTAAAAVAVGLTQQYINYFGATGMGDLSVLILLAAVLLLRPQGIFGGKTA
ncbi:MAG: branched-chain amino acid ABC transporter permease [Hamadaea sp.]|nr:branched-chain amino acid ABC transporter permease [Hamadaea sp.]